MTIDLARHLENQRGPLKEALRSVVSIPSVVDEGGDGFPFGKGIDDALRETLRIAKGLGFQAKYGDGGYYGYAEVGAGAEMLGILGHLDVVPAGNLDAWKTDPFEPLEMDGKLFGRGTQDDKGPTLAAMFAVKVLMDAGMTFNKRVRIIFGTDEETLWRGINRYLENEERPGMGFSPDGKFPLTYAEKGLLQLQLEGSSEGDVTLKGGSAFNAVPDAIIYEGEGQDRLTAKLDELGYGYQLVERGVKVLGKAAHAMAAEKGINAIARLCIALQAIGLDSKATRFVAQEIGEDAFATQVFGQCSDQPSGRLKFNVGKINVGTAEQLSIDIRIPVTVAKEEIVEKLSAVAEKHGLAFKEYDWLAPIYLPLDHPLIETLMDVYRRVTRDTESEPESSGGATYARAIDNCVAFGALLPGKPEVEHQPNEFVVLDDLYVAMEVYANAVYELTR